METVMADHGPFLRRLALNLVRNSADADDLVQDVWLAAATTAQEKTIREPRAWLASVLRRRAASEHRRRRPELLVNAEDEASSREAAQDLVAQQLEREATLQAALAELDEPYRTALYLRFHDGLMPKAIAERMDAPVKTVNSWLSRGLQKMRDRLDTVYGGGEEGRTAWLAGMTLLATHGQRTSLPAPDAAVMEPVAATVGAITAASGAGSEVLWPC
ncbi:MAG: sigma-70 family RNA polymerase sigma factor, partial [Planctomycetota bacterium]